MSKLIQQLRNSFDSMSMEEILRCAQREYHITNWSEIDREELIEKMISIEVGNMVK